MKDYAIVVGCDAYPNLPNGNLTTAVADALAFRDWLCNDLRAAAADITVLVSPSAPDTNPYGPATRAAIAQAVANLVARRDIGRTDRLFVYFAGHGCGTDPGSPVLSKDALAFADYLAVDPAGSCVGVQDMVLRLEQSCFGSVVLFLDACRDFPFTTAFQLSGLGVDPAARNGDPRRPAVYLAQATFPGGVTEAAADGGVFTGAVLRGLRGDGSAKVFDELANPPYVVRWSSLRDYLNTAFPDRELRLRGDDDIVLATFPDGSFPSVKLTVDVEPPAKRVASDLQVRVRFPDPTFTWDDLLERPHSGPVPVTLEVPPRRHQVDVAAGSFRSRRSFDVYEDRRVTLSLSDSDLAAAYLDTHHYLFRSPRTGQVRVTADNPYSAVEIRDVSGAVRLTGVGTVRGSLPPDLYYAVLIDPDGHDAVQPFDVEWFGTRSVSLAAAPLSDPFRSAIATVDALRWASGGAIAANDAIVFAQRRPRDESVVGVYGTGALPAVPVSVATVAGEVDIRGLAMDGPHYDGHGWSVRLGGIPGMARVGITVGDHMLSVPTLSGAATGVFLGARDLVVGLYDRVLGERPDALLRLDSAQGLLRGGRYRAAATVLESVGADDRTQIWETLVVLAAGVRAGSATAAAVPSADQRHIIGGGPWDVRDRTVGDRG
jgi:uncharacterized caspase-like protein